MADSTPGGNSSSGGTAAANGAGFGKFIAGLVLGIVVGGFAGAYLTPMVGNQSISTPPAGKPRPPGTVPHQAEEEAARKMREEAEAARKAQEDAKSKPTPAPSPPPPTGGGAVAPKSGG